jgi:peptidoglycan/LPS O-acetylase OafA/YrhL
VAFCAAMLIHTPDPTYTGSEPTRANFRLAVKIALHIVALIWLIELLNSGLDLGLERFGVRPRQLVGLPGILLAPLLHAGLIRRDRRAIAATLLVCFMYGALAWGVLPIEPGVSWETHLAAALIGVLLVITLRHLDIPPRALATRGKRKGRIRGRAIQLQRYPTRKLSRALPRGRACYFNPR